VGKPTCTVLRGGIGGNVDLLPDPVVFVVGTEEGLLPHVRPQGPGEPEPDDAEERRLTYVALSRCQVQLYLTYCRTRRPMIGGEPGRPESRRPSRYLRELPPDLVERAA
jgi:ATP-dependent DNA helicase UvrD/PcrA